MSITGMICSACPAHVEKAVSRLEGMEKASVNLPAEKMEVSYDEGRLNSGDIIAAMESADIVLMKSDLRDAVTAVRLSRAVIRNIKQNLFRAFFYNAIGIPLTAGVWYPLFEVKLNPVFEAAAMSLSS